MEKKCSKCNEIKDESLFFVDITKTLKLSSQCKDCISERQKIYNKKNRNAIIENKKFYYANNRERVIASIKANQSSKVDYVKSYRANRYLKNKEEIDQKNREYYQNNKEKRRHVKAAWHKMQKEINPLFRIRLNYRNRISKFIKKQGFYRTESTTDILGIDWNGFKTYIENLFSDGMTWDNYGTNGWHIDHIKPLVSATTLDELKQLNHYTNLQPMWAVDNIKKGAKYGTSIK